ncbi:hypothetical protein CR513_31446, partial [Mucuna pruriens]
MSPAELMIRREKGLCYTCDAKFSLGLRFPNKQYMLIEAEAFQGTPSKAIIRFDVLVGGTEVQILLNGGSSNSYIHLRIVQHLKLPIEPTKNMQVMVGDGYVMKGKGLIKNLTVQIQGHVIEIPTFVLPVANSDVVFGASRLAILGPHMANYTIGDSYIEFLEDIIEGYNSSNQGPKSIQEEMQELLQRYQHIFEKPHGLLPLRGHEHHITLEKGAGPIKVRPYCYPFSQKT